MSEKISIREDALHLFERRSIALENPKLTVASNPMFEPRVKHAKVLREGLHQRIIERFFVLCDADHALTLMEEEANKVYV